jgi:hypothetical protein
MKLTRLFLATAFLLGSTVFAPAQKAPAPTPTPTQAPGGSKKGAKSAVPVADQCQAMTKAGTQCKRKASAGSKFCWQHGGKKA